MGVRRVALLIGVIVLLCGCVFGQGESGTLSGTVLDPGGAAVPNAKILVKNLTTGATRDTVTTAEGIFVFNSLYAAKYDLTITAPAGFKTYSSKAINLTANEKRDLGRISLVLGSLSEEISVSAAATPVQTNSSENSKLVEGTQIDAITMKGRDLFGILQTIPGISFGNNLLSGNGDATSNGSGTFGAMQVNGGGTARSNFTVDGVIDMDNGNNSQVDFEPTTDTIAEIRVLTSNYQAEFGHSSSGQISVITKGGSQEFHGSANVNKRHEMWNAHTWAQDYQGITDKTKYRYFVSTYTIGGPIYIPHLFNTQKKKLFFFWSQEYTKQKPTSNSTVTAMVPTSAQLAGNFADRCAVDATNKTPTGACAGAYVNGSGIAQNGPASGYLIDPTNAARSTALPNADLTQLVGKSINGQNIIDPASSTMGQAFLKDLPLPNMCTAAAGISNGQAISPTNCPAGYLTGLPYGNNPGWNYGANYVWGYTQAHPRRNDTARVDWNITSRLNTYVRWTRDTDKSNQNYNTPIRNADASYTPFSLDFALPGHGIAVGATYTITPTMVNEFTFGKIWNGVGWYAHNENQLLSTNITSTAIPGFNILANDPNVTGPGNQGAQWMEGRTGYLNWGPYVPSISYGASNGRNETSPSTGCGWGTCPYTNWAESWTFSDNISKVQGKHNLKAGVYIEKTAKDQQGGQGTYVGSWNFSSASGANPLDTGDGYANAWLGDYNNFSQGTRNFSEWWFWQVEAFVQDSWRVSPRLTLDLGARFYAMPPITNTSTGVNASAEFVPAAYNKAAMMRIYEQGCENLATGAFNPTTTAACPNNASFASMAWDRATNTFAPNRLVGTFVPQSVGGYSATPSATEGIVLADGSSSLLPKGLYTPPKLSPALRFGFAWDVFGDGKTAVRGGIGQFLNRLSYNQVAGANSYSLNPAQLTYYGHIMDVNQPAVKSAGIMGYQGLSVGYLGNQQNESTYNGSVGIQRNIGFSTIIEANWVFNLRRHIASTVNRNYEPMFSQFEQNANWVNPMAAYQQNPAITGYPSIANNGMALTSNNYIYQMNGVCDTCVAGYSQIVNENFNETANYHALQVNVRRNMTKHFSFGWSFTWNKYMSASSANLYNSDPGIGRSQYFADKYRNWGPSYTPAPLYFTANVVYEAPNLGQKLNFKPLGFITDHWTISTLGQWRSDSMASVPGWGFSNTSGTCSSPANPPAGTWSNCYPQWNWTGSTGNVTSPTGAAVDGSRVNVVGDYHLSSIGKTWAWDPAVPTTSATAIAQPANASPAVGSSLPYDSFSTGDNWVINPAAFATPMPCSKGPSGTLGISPFTNAGDPHYGTGENLACFGNAGSGSLLNIPGTRVNNWDLTMSKQFPFKSEKRNLTFRMEMYNVLNHPNFTGGGSNDTWDYRNWLQGRLINTNASVNRLSTTPLNPRQMSMTLRLVF